MAVRSYKPTSAGRRAGQVNDYTELTAGKRRPIKSLLQPLKKKGGRNHSGKITAPCRGGGHKRQYRRIDFKRLKDGIQATVVAIEYDPNRSCHIALIRYDDGQLSYILAPAGLREQQVVCSGPAAEPLTGNAMPLKRIPIGMDVHNIELHPGRGGVFARSAGATARLLAREGDWATLVMPSGEMRQVRVECRATIGRVGNIEHQNISLGKAGRKRHLGRRPNVRGVAMNPVAHPLGGGEGRSGGGRHPCSPTGKPAKGGRTRNPRKGSNNRILRRRKSKRYGQVKL